MATLNEAERETLNAAMAILTAHTPQPASWLLSVSNYHGTPSCSATYFDTAKTQHTGLWAPDCTFADKVQMALDIEAEVETDAEARRAARVERLRSELAALTGEAA